MPARDNHLHQAQHNEAFVVSLNLDSTDYLDWAVTGIFYAALHYIESFLATQNIHSSTHASRDRVFQQQQNLKPIYNQYRILKTRSESARYDLQQFNLAEARTLISVELEAVKSHILRVSQKP
jgi:uncharacterized protein (UPF0332 family)